MMIMNIQEWTTRNHVHIMESFIPSTAKLLSGTICTKENTRICKEFVSTLNGESAYESGMSKNPRFVYICLAGLSAIWRFVDPWICKNP